MTFFLLNLRLKSCDLKIYLFFFGKLAPKTPSQYHKDQLHIKNSNKGNAEGLLLVYFVYQMFQTKQGCLTDQPICSRSGPALLVSHALAVNSNPWSHSFYGKFRLLFFFQPLKSKFTVQGKTYTHSFTIEIPVGWKNHPTHAY